MDYFRAQPSGLRGVVALHPGSLAKLPSGTGFVAPAPSSTSTDACPVRCDSLVNKQHSLIDKVALSNQVNDHTVFHVISGIFKGPMHNIRGGHPDMCLFVRVSF